MPIDLPDTHFRAVSLRLVTPQQVSRSDYSGRRQVMSNPWHGRWMIEAEHVPIVGVENFRAWKTFFAKLRGQETTFRFPVTEESQHESANPTVSSGGAAGANTLTLSASVALVAGMHATVPLDGGGEQLVLLTQDIDGSNVITFEPPLRDAADSGGEVETVDPYVVVALDASEAGFTIGAGQFYPAFTIVASEAY